MVNLLKAKQVLCIKAQLKSISTFLTFKSVLLNNFILKHRLFKSVISQLCYGRYLSSQLKDGTGGKLRMLYCKGIVEYFLEQQGGLEISEPVASKFKTVHFLSKKFKISICL